MKHITMLSALAVMAVASIAAAVTPGEWDQKSEADFTGGRLESAVLSSHGQIRLGRPLKVLMPTESSPSVVAAVAIAGETIYAASGSDSAVYKIEGGKSAVLAKPPGAIVCSLLWTGSELLAGTGGDGAGIYRIDKAGKVEKLWSDDKVKYIWAMLAAPDGWVYAATGPEAAVWRVPVKANGKAEPLYKLSDKLAKNVLCLAAGEGGAIYAGTDQSGLVVRIDPAAKTGRIILDAQESDISAIVAGANGVIYAATTDGAKSGGEGEPAPAADKAGKPEAASAPATGAAGAASASSKASAASETAPKESEPDEGLATVETEPSSGPSASHEGHAAASPVSGGGEGTGNAVYLIQADGLVRTIFRRPLAISAMTMLDGMLLLGTGNAGDIYTLSTDGDEIVRIADTDAKQITALAVDAGGRIVFGSSNNGSVGELPAVLGKEGTFTSAALDAKQIARWGTVRVRFAAPAGTAVAFSMRSGNMHELDPNTWSAWTKEQPANADFTPLSGPAGRFFQYRVKLIGDGKLSPELDGVDVIYQVGNLPPRLAGVTVKPSATAEGEKSSPPRGRSGQGEQPEPQPLAFRIVEIQASDENNDQLAYKVEFRLVGTSEWIQAAEKLNEPTYVWDTRTVGDGLYELRVTAGDEPSNPPSSALKAMRISEPVAVDNTAPLVKNLAAKLDKGAVVVSGEAADAASRVAAIHYAVDSAKDWVAVLPADGICDSKSEQFEFRIPDLKPGEHRIAVRIRDAFDNFGYAAVSVTVK